MFHVMLGDDVVCYYYRYTSVYGHTYVALLKKVFSLFELGVFQHTWLHLYGCEVPEG